MEHNNRESLFVEIDKERNDMHSYLYQSDVAPSVKEKLQDQLKWFNHQVNHYKEAPDLEVFLDKFNWMVKNFNEELNLDHQERFPLQFQSDERESQ
ncbi:MAG: hypothetical protein MRY21_01500 [Simkaniaceae bacterium]|nr:hypothetical protein [Simkaniaceae bacterium]